MKGINTISIFLLAILGLASVVVGASSYEKKSTNLFVKPEGTGDCTSWTNACELETALSLANSGDQVWVAAGTYKPTSSSNREATFQLESGVAIYGGFPSAGGTWEDRDWETNTTTLSGDIGLIGDNADNSYHVVTGNGVDGTAILDGFTITAGNANGSSSSQKLGGGIYNVSNSSPILSNVTFSENAAGWGGGMYNEGSNPSLSDVTFSGNTAINRGGGMYNYISSPTLSNVTFSGNSATEGGGIHNFESSNPTLINVTFSSNSAQDGGGMYNYTSNPSLTHVTFSGNTATYWGGGMMNVVNSNPNLTNVTLSGNTAGETGGGMFNGSSSPTISHSTFSKNTAENGGGMYNSQASPVLTNVTFSINTATFGSGGGMSNYYFSGTMTNVTFYGNTAYLGSGAMKSERSSPTVVNAIFWGNTPYQLENVAHSYPTISYSIIQGGYAGEGNLADDPLLGSLADNGGFSQTHALGVGSPAIDAGSPSLCPPTDQRGFHRPIDGDNSGSENCDIGAYEYDSDPVVFPLTVDVVGSGSVAKNPDKSEYQFGEVVILTATASPGWTYTGWSEDASGTTNPLPISILDDTSITANFTQNEYTLTVRSDPDSSGSVTIDPEQDTYHYGDVVTLTASPNTAWSFVGWSGDVTDIENPVEVTIMGNTSITAAFTQNEYTLTVMGDSEGFGSVTIDPEQSTYHYGDNVTLTALPTTDWRFAYWGGDASGTENPLTITIQGDTSITAYWEKVLFKTFLPLIVK